MALGGTERVTTAPAPTIACAPTVMPGSKVALAPIDAPWRTTVRAKASGRCRLRGERSLLKGALGGRGGGRGGGGGGGGGFCGGGGGGAPKNPPFPSRLPSHSWTPHLMVT